MEKRYVYGNTARKINNPQRRDDIPLHVQKRAQAKRRAHRMSFGYLLFLTLAVVATGVILTWYITLQAQIKNSVKTVSTLEAKLNTLRQDNDEAYNKAVSSLDLEEIKRIAIGEYGMTYATEGQIVEYSNEGGNDYVRQVAPIPDGN
ncbi:cell division protein FtsL [Butyrivibrio sp. NC2002]|jgi:cell division protein FtsL|uniref:cell division protein FtsL n=1 Tax=Butyrivibrio sp. NC2002 TaxID=1410610 RepID=UPI0005635DE9|nr:cell division protein FtsL [Butyrivibrio sp. NC2002]